MTCGQVWLPILWICALHFNPSYVHTYSSEHPHTAVNTHPEQWTAIYAAAPREQLGVRCPWHLSRGIEGGVEIALVIHSPHLQSLPDLRLEPATLGYESDSLKVRPRLPTIKAGMVNLLWTVNLLFNFLINRFSYFFFSISAFGRWFYPKQHT